METTNTERRVVTRRPLEAPLFLRCGGYGVTTDISATGVRFESAQPLAAGEGVQFLLDLAGSRVQLWCSGRVVRTEVRAGKTFIAATIDEIEFSDEVN